MNRRQIVQRLSLAVIFLSAPLALDMHKGVVLNNAYACSEEEPEVEDCVADDTPGGFTCCTQTNANCYREYCDFWIIHCHNELVQANAYFREGACP